jgi:hypothetical protein
VERRFNFEGPRIEGYGIVAIILVIARGSMVFFNKASTF